MSQHLADDLWLDAEDLLAIGAAVDGMVLRLEADQTPIRITDRPSLRGIEVHAERGEGPIAAETIKAAFATPKLTGARSAIQLAPFPLTVEDAAPLKADPERFRRMMRSVLAHEITHVRQRQFADEATQDALLEADRLSERARDTKAFADYAAYVSHPLETAAHGTQLAVEALDAAGPGLDRAAFDTACNATRLWSHIRGHPEYAADAADRATRFDALTPGLRQAAWRAYERLAA